MLGRHRCRLLAGAALFAAAMCNSVAIAQDGTNESLRQVDPAAQSAAQNAASEAAAEAARQPALNRTLAQEATEAGLTGEARVDYILERMTVEEKLGQLHQMAGGRSKNLNSRLNEEEFARIRSGLVGSYLHVAGAEILGNLQTVATKQSRHGVPLLFAMDVVHGYRTIMPVPLAMAASFDEDIVEQAARVAGDEASSAGLHWTFAPMVDIARDPRWGRIVEGAGEEPYLGSVMATAQVRGYQGEDLASGDTILATAKHFGAYGAGIGGRDYNTSDISDRTLKEVYLPPFYAAAKEGSGSFMVAFNDIAGVPTTANKVLVHDLLRDEWGYQGLVVSDWNSVLELINHGVAETKADAGALALAASVDMEMTSGIYVNDMADRVKSDPALQAALDASARRVMMAKDRLGLFDDPLAYHDSAREAATILSDANRAVALEAAHKAMVLLKNDGTLPLSGKVKQIAVIGDLAQDEWSPLGSWRAQGKTEDVKTVLDGLSEGLPDGVKMTYAPGYGGYSAALNGDLVRAVKDAKGADAVILVIGENYDLSGEARSRSDISIPADQLELADAIFATGKPVVVVLMNGRPLDLTPINDRAEAILETWMLGIETGPAVADVLFGRVSPGGKLPVSFPRRTGQAPYYMGHNNTGRPADPDLSKDTARYMDIPITPLYAFGHGLTYSSFALDGLEQSAQSIGPGDEIEISFTLTNTGDVAAEEVPQLYIRDPFALIARPVQELRGFRRIRLDPGEMASVSFVLTPDQFAYIGPDGDWMVEAGRIDYMIGTASDDISLTGSFEISEGFAATQPAAAIETKSFLEIPDTSN